jgi:D-3-phosphoglycerate dehydrogenase / 2-oxoglutarate reductase
MKIAVTDYTFESLDTERSILEPLGGRLVGPCPRAEHDLIELVGDADAVITQFASVSAPVIAAMQRARVIVRYGIGVDNVDLDAARQHGIPVCNVPDYCIDEVADHTVGLILALTRRLAEQNEQVRRGSWKSAVPLDAMKALKHLTVGIVGCGRIGREVASRLRAFKCKLLAYDPGVPAADIERAGCTPLPLPELLREADVITLHCPSNAHTRRMINRDALAQMKRGAILINVARGDLIDTKALIDSLRDGRLSAVGLDVCDPEPIPADHPILKMDNVIVTPHIASASVPAVTALRTRVAETVALALRGEPLPNIVNGVTGPGRTASPGL